MRGDSNKPMLLRRRQWKPATLSGSCGLVTSSFRHKGRTKTNAQKNTFSNLKTKLLLVCFFCIFPLVLLEANPPFTTLDVRSATRGTKVDRSGSYSTSSFQKEVRTTDRVVSIKVHYKTFRDVDKKFEIQCFFIGRDPDGNRFVYDAYKFVSDKKEEEFILDAKDLFGSKKTTTVSSSVDSLGSAGTLKTIIYTKSVKQGSRCLGWIVRLYYDGQFVRTQTSAREMEDYADESSEELSSIAMSLDTSDIPTDS